MLTSVWAFFRQGKPVSTLPYTDPLHAGRHPFQTYMLALCVLSSLPLLVGQATAEAVERNLPFWMAYAWGVFLLVGSAIALIGSYWKGAKDTALTLERAGLDVTGSAALVYGACVLGSRSVSAPVGGLLIAAGAFMLIQAFKSTSVAGNTRWLGIGSGVLLFIGGSAILLLSPAIAVLVGASIIIGFGGSCIRRSRDISRIFHRALEDKPLPVETEFE